MHDYKHLSRPSRLSRALDDIATTLAWLTATVLVIFYGLGMTP